MFDTHTHSKYSYDSKQEPEELIQYAIKLGADYLAITDHCDKDFLFTTEFANTRQIDLKARFADMVQLKEKYKSQITLAVGLECGYMSPADSIYNKILSEYPTDIVINSVHLVQHEDCYFKLFFDKRTKAEAYGQYLSAVRSSLDCSYPYDVVAHFGYVSRKTTYLDAPMDYASFAEPIDDILKVIIAKNKALEVNTHFAREWGEFLPTCDILKRYKELGGKLVTFGSDAHWKERLFDKFDVATSALQQLGFEYVFKYLNHAPIAVKI